jgi:hypothetical protein
VGGFWNSAASDGAELGVRGDAGGGIMRGLGGIEPQHHHAKASAGAASEMQRRQGWEEEGAGAVAGGAPDACLWRQWRICQVAAGVGPIQAPQFVWYGAPEPQWSDFTLFVGAGLNLSFSGFG